MSTLPELTRKVDDYYTSTWYSIRPEAVDNITKATVVSAALKELGCFHPQTGGEYITETIKYNTTTTKDVTESTVFGMGRPKLETVAHWNWKYYGTEVQRSLLEDQKNSGPDRIKSLVETRIADARDAMAQSLEEKLLADYSGEAESQTAFQSLYWIVPGGDSDYMTSSYEYGKIKRSNTWWQPTLKDCSSYSLEIDLLEIMKNTYNTIGAQLESPKLIITTQDIYEAYETYVEDKTQIIKDATTNLADLGFDVLRYRGKPMVWSENVTAGDMLMLNTDHIKVVYDPNLWFDMTEWKPAALELHRFAQIVSAINVICNLMARQGKLYNWS